jgi:hypothetical protein
MKQHYVSQTYQDGFLDPTPPPGHVPFTWIYFREAEAWKAKAPRNFAWATDLYTLFREDGSRDDTIEEMLSRFEDRFAAAMRVDLTQTALNPQQRADISYFATLLLIRPPRVLRAFLPQLFGSGATLRLLHDKLPGFADAMKKQFRDPEPERVAAWFGSLSASNQKQVIFAIMLPAVNADAERLYKLSWSYCFTMPEYPFISSDTPVRFKFPDGERRPDVARLLDDLGVEVSFPMSATVCLVARHGDGLQRRGAVTPGEVKELNSRVLWQSKEFIFTSRRSFPGDSELQQWAARRPLPDVSRATALVSGKANQRPG